MDVKGAIKSQYHAALKTLREAVEKCPDAAWNNPAIPLPPPATGVFWRVAYHTLFFTHFYLQKDEHSFVPWERNREESHIISSVSRENNRPPKPCEPYTRQDILDYWKVCDDMVDGAVDAMDLSAPESGFHWYKMPKLEHQLVNIRHIQHHAAALSARLRHSDGIGIPWVGQA